MTDLGTGGGLFDAEDLRVQREEQVLLGEVMDCCVDVPVVLPEVLDRALGLEYRQSPPR